MIKRFMPATWAENGSTGYSDLWLSCARAFHYGGNGLREDFCVEPERPFVQVLQVKLHPVIKTNVAPAIHLPKASDAGAHAEAASLPVFTKAFVVSHGQWPRTDQAHVTLKHIQ